MKEQAITTAARAIADKMAESWFEPPSPLHLIEEGVAEAAVDAVRPLIMAEEHDRLRRQIEAAALAVGKQYAFGPEPHTGPHTDAYMAAHTDDIGPFADGYTQDGYLEAVGRDLLAPVLALLGESTQEPASE